MTIEEKVRSYRKTLKKEETLQNEKLLVQTLEALDAIPMTKDLLKATGIGKTVTKIFKEKGENVAALAGPLLKKWRDSARKSIEASKSTTSSSSAGVKSDTDKNATDEIPKKDENSKSENVSATEEPTMPTEKVRARIVALFEKVFKKGNEDLKKITLKSIQLEQALFVKGGNDFKSKNYKDKFRQLKFNLEANDDLRGDTFSGIIDCETLVNMESSQMASSTKRKERVKAKAELMDASRSDWLDANRDFVNKQAGVKQTGGLFKCGRCKSTKTTHYQKQTRSADEPMTVFIQCTECGNRWRQ